MKIKLIYKSWSFFFLYIFKLVNQNSLSLKRKGKYQQFFFLYIWICRQDKKTKENKRGNVSIFLMLCLISKYEFKKNGFKLTTIFIYIFLKKLFLFFDKY